MKKLHWVAAVICAALVLASIWTVTPTIAQTVRAALVRDTDNPALQPARLWIGGSVDTTGYLEADGDTVPAGKRLVVETVSVFGYPPSSPGLTAVWLTTDSIATYVSLDPKANEQFANYVAFNRNMRMYFNAGEKLRIQVFGASGTYINVFFHGYYVTL